MEAVESESALVTAVPPVVTSNLAGEESWMIAKSPFAAVVEVGEYVTWTVH
jgi:hypothetical protein